MSKNKEHELYEIWKAMRQRCNNPHNKDYPSYGGRGISIDKEWDNFWMFVWDMGERPEGFQLDREDNDGDYTAENCRWVDKIVQMENRGCRKDNSLGLPNIQYRKETGSYRVDIKRGGRKLNKTFRSVQEAVEARNQFLKENV